MKKINVSSICFINILRGHRYIFNIFKYIFLFLLLFYNYNYGIFVDDFNFYKYFQMDSEALVFGNIERTKYKIDSKYGLGRFLSNYTTNLGTPIKILNDSMHHNRIDTLEYILLIANNDYTKKFYKNGNIVKFKDGNSFKIVKTAEDKQYLHVYLDNSQKIPIELNQPLSSIYVYDTQGNGSPSYSFWAYPSQFGLQGKLFSFLLQQLSPEEYIYTIHFVCSFMTAFVLLIISIFIGKKYNYLMAASFYIVFLLSPWITAFARNGYWVEFTWFLPILGGLLCSIYNKNRKIVSGCLVFIFLSFLIKCLCGYEYITTIMLTTISFLIFDLFFSIRAKDTLACSNNLKLICLSSIVLISGFIIAIGIHAYLRGDGSFLAGLKNIYTQDVLRRLYGDPSQFPSVLAASLAASPLVVLYKYFNFHTSILYNMCHFSFYTFILLPLIIFIYSFINKKIIINDLILYIIFFICSISWFLIGKSHSFIHTHMNYVLWYFGFIQICVYIILKNIFMILKIINNIFSYFFKF